MFSPSQLASQKNFYGVSLLLIVLGAGIFATGVVQWILTMIGDWQFGWPMAKVAGGLMILGIGYIVLELELIRHKK